MSIRIEKITVAMIRGFKATTTPSRGFTSIFVILHNHNEKKGKKCLGKKRTEAN